MKKLLLLFLLSGPLSLFAQEYYPFQDQQTGKQGYREKTGKVAIPAKYDHAGYFLNNKLAPVKLGNQYGYIDKAGNLVIPVRYDFAETFGDGYAIVKKGNSYGLINEAGKEVIPVTMEKITRYYKEEVLGFRSGGKWGFFSIPEHKEIIAPVYEDTKGFSEKLCSVKKNGKWGYIDVNGKEMIAFGYDDAERFYNKMAAVSLGGKWGYISVKGKTVIELQYDEVSEFSKERAFVKQQGKWGMINKSGKPVIQAKYDRVMPEDVWFGKLVRAYIGNELYLVDIDGKEYSVKECDDVRIEDEYPSNLLIGTKGGKMGLLDMSGKLLTEVKYDSIEFNYDVPKLIIATIKGKKLVLGENGEELTKLYDNIEAGELDDLWLKDAGGVYKANIKGFTAPVPAGMLPASDHTFADAREVSVGDYLTFLTDQRDVQDFRELLPDTNDLPVKYRAAFRVFYKGEPVMIKSPSQIVGSSLQVCIQKGANEKDLGKIFAYPVTGISYKQALAYCDWRSKKYNEKELPGEEESIIKFRLPSPEEWEAIAVAGLKKGTAAPDSINKESCMLFNYRAVKACKTSEDMVKNRGEGAVYINDFWPSFTGHLNMFGNAAEMTSVESIAKGGSYLHFASECAPAEKQEYASPQPWLGFRCVAEYHSRYRDKAFHDSGK